MTYKNKELYSFDSTPNATEDKKEYIKVLKSTDSRKNEAYVNIRTYYTETSEDGKREIKPSRKGVFFNSENLFEVMKALALMLEADEVMDLAEYLEGISNNGLENDAE